MFIVINPTGISNLSEFNAIEPKLDVIEVEPDVTVPTSMFAEPLNETLFIVLAVANIVAVAAFPVVEPDVPEVLPVTFPSKFATSVPTAYPVPLYLQLL